MKCCPHLNNCLGLAQVIVDYGQVSAQNLVHLENTVGYVPTERYIAFS